jgi:carboxyl-terminal processing protease
MKKIKVYLIALSIGFSAALSYGFADNYFHISKNLDIFSSLYKELNTFYVDETQPGDLMKTAIDAMLKSLDPYTNYIPESQIEDFRFMTTGQYGGIGALIHKDSNYVVISEPYKGFPAYRAGLKAGDVIVKIDGKSVKGKNTEEVSDFLKGQAGTAVKITLKRPGTDRSIEKEVERENIKIDEVPYYGMLDEEVGYIKLVSFTQTASKSFEDAFKDLKENQGMKKLVFDLRGNGGGLLMEAVKIVNAFVSKGSVVVETKGKREEWDATYRTSSEPLDTEMRVVILVNGTSASASEIVSGAVQDYDRGVIIGKQTFGKGLVQQTRPLSYNAQLKVTVAKYYIPSGRCIQKVDYSHKDVNGKAKNIPDSMIHSFKTLVSKREVFDGKGIKPDVITDQQKMSKISQVLLRKLHIFGFATEYALKHDTIPLPQYFQLDDETYNDFKKYLSDKDYSYQTESEQLLKKLEETAKKEKYYDGAEDEYADLKSKIVEDKEDDLNKFGDEIKQLLENEIVSRYYYQDGRIAQSLNDDDDILKALEVINGKQYNEILAGTFEKGKK